MTVSNLFRVVQMMHIKMKETQPEKVQFEKKQTQDTIEKMQLEKKQMQLEIEELKRQVRTLKRNVKSQSERETKQVILIAMTIQ